MNEEQYATVLAKLASNDTEHGSFRRRLDEHDEALKKQNDILVILERQSNNIERLTGSMNRMEASMGSMDKRLGTIEQEPADKWRKVTWEIIKAVLLAAVGFGLSFFAKGA